MSEEKTESIVRELERVHEMVVALLETELPDGRPTRLYLMDTIEDHGPYEAYRGRDLVILKEERMAPRPLGRVQHRVDQTVVMLTLGLSWPSFHELDPLPRARHLYLRALLERLNLADAWWAAVGLNAFFRPEVELDSKKWVVGVPLELPKRKDPFAFDEAMLSGLLQSRPPDIDSMPARAWQLSPRAGENFEYAAWLLTHYALVGADDGGMHRHAFLAILDEIRMGSSDSLTLFSRWWGKPFGEISAELDRYSRRERFPVLHLPVKTMQEVVLEPLRRLTRGEKEILTWELRALLGDPERTLDRLRTRLRKNVSLPMLEFAGGLAWEHGSENLALEYWERAADQGSRRSLVLRAEVETELRRRLRAGQLDTFLSAEQSERWREQLDRAWSANPRDQNTITWMAWLEALSDHPDPKTVNLIQQQISEMVRPRLAALALAQIRLRVSDPKTARAILQPLQSWPQWEWAPLVTQLTERLETTSNKSDPE